MIKGKRDLHLYFEATAKTFMERERVLHAGRQRQIVWQLHSRHTCVRRTITYKEAHSNIHIADRDRDLLHPGLIQ